MSKIYTLYRITNINENHFEYGWIYIGVHKIREKYSDSYICSSRRLKRSIKEQGIENFKREIIEYFDTKEEMYQRELELVNREFIARSDTYNIQIGGSYVPIYSCQDKKIIHKDNKEMFVYESELDYFISQGWVIGISGKRRSNIGKTSKGRKHSEETKQRMSENMKGNTNRIGIKHTEEDKKKISDALKVTFKNPEVKEKLRNRTPSMLGKNFSNESKKKISDAMKGRVWINRNGMTKYVHKNELQEYLNNGWQKGRGKVK